jgi:hypothetical protein
LIEGKYSSSIDAHYTTDDAVIPDIRIAANRKN